MQPQLTNDEWSFIVGPISPRHVNVAVATLHPLPTNASASHIPHPAYTYSHISRVVVDVVVVDVASSHTMLLRACRYLYLCNSTQTQSYTRAPAITHQAQLTQNARACLYNIPHAMSFLLCVCGLYVYVYCVWNIVRNRTLSIVATVVGGRVGNGAMAMVMTVVVVWRWCIIQNPNDCSV